MAEFIKEMVRTIVVGALMPTGKSLVPTLRFVLIITALSFVCRLLGLPTYFSVGGCVLAVTVLLVLLHIERSEYRQVTKFYEELERRKNEVSQLHRDVELRVKGSKGRQPTASSSGEDERTVNVSQQCTEDDD